MDKSSSKEQQQVLDKSTNKQIHQQLFMTLAAWSMNNDWEPSYTLFYISQSANGSGAEAAGVPLALVSSVSMAVAASGLAFERLL